eukprot:756398-Hanusia_phi.AAC.1
MCNEAGLHCILDKVGDPKLEVEGSTPNAYPRSAADSRRSPLPRARSPLWSPAATPASSSSAARGLGLSPTGPGRARGARPAPGDRTPYGTACRAQARPGAARPEPAGSQAGLDVVLFGLEAR